MRAATEFVGALGANVGIGMILREGTRAALKFFPGWGNVVCGMVAGAGTFAIGRAAMVYFIEGATLRDARRAFAQNKKKLPCRAARRPKALREPIRNLDAGFKRNSAVTARIFRRHKYRG